MGCRKCPSAATIARRALGLRALSRLSSAVSPCLASKPAIVARTPQLGLFECVAQGLNGWHGALLGESSSRADLTHDGSVSLSWHLIFLRWLLHLSRTRRESPHQSRLGLVVPHQAAPKRARDC